MPWKSIDQPRYNVRPVRLSEVEDCNLVKIAQERFEGNVSAAMRELLQLGMEVLEVGSER